MEVFLKWIQEDFCSKNEVSGTIKSLKGDHHEKKI
jgi:hypothetical protein